MEFAQPQAVAAANALRQIVRAIRLSAHIAEQALGVSGAQLFVLQQLAAVPGASLRELADRTLTDQSSVSVVVSRLVERRLIKRRTATRDARRAELSLTAAGRAIVGKAPPTAQEQLVASLRELPRTELRVATRVLERVARNMGADGTPASMFFERDT